MSATVLFFVLLAMLCIGAVLASVIIWGTGVLVLAMVISLFVLGFATLAYGFKRARTRIEENWQPFGDVPALPPEIGPQIDRDMHRALVDAGYAPFKPYVERG